ncbi:MAG: antitoxin VapB family protein [Candidatus Thorarchaeota archaeon]
MGSRTISVSDEAYTRLKALKKRGDSFSDVINRLTDKKRLSDLAGVLNEKEVKKVEAEIASIRKRSKKRMRRLVQEISEE